MLQAKNKDPDKKKGAGTPLPHGTKSKANILTSACYCSRLLPSRAGYHSQAECKVKNYFLQFQKTCCTTYLRCNICYSCNCSLTCFKLPIILNELDPFDRNSITFLWQDTEKIDIQLSNIISTGKILKRHRK